MQPPSINSPYNSFLTAGDIILRVGGVKINTPEDLTTALTAFKGKEIGLYINHGGKQGTIKRVKKAGNTWEIANDFFTLWRNTKSRRGKGLTVEPIRLTFTKLAEEFISWAETPAADYSSSWLRDIKYMIAKHVKHWGTLDIADITPEILDKWQIKRLHEVSRSTVANESKPLRKAFNLAVKRGYLENSPADILNIREARKTTPKYLSRAEIRTLLECAAEADRARLVPYVSKKGGAAISPVNVLQAKKYYNTDGTFDTARIRFFLLTALRKSQLTSLTWQQYDNKRHTLTLESRPGEHTEKSRRVTVIPIPDEARIIIEGQPRRRGCKYIFPNIMGNCDKEIRKRFARIASKMEENGGPHVHLHMLRHTALTYLLESIGDIAAVQAYAGHADIRMTQRYAHILPSKLADLTKGFTIASPEPNPDIRKEQGKEEAE